MQAHCSFSPAAALGCIALTTSYCFHLFKVRDEWDEKTGIDSGYRNGKRWMLLDFRASHCHLLAGVAAARDFVERFQKEKHVFSLWCSAGQFWVLVLGIWTIALLGSLPRFCDSALWVWSAESIWVASKFPLGLTQADGILKARHGQQIINHPLTLQGYISMPYHK